MPNLRSDEAPVRALESLADTYGPLYQINVRGRRVLVVSSAEIVKGFMDEKKVEKRSSPLLAGTNANGLFTAASDDPDWVRAHRILLPAFEPIAIEDMLDGTDFFHSTGFWIADHFIRHEGHCDSTSSQVGKERS